jgi:hypothetical protein
MPQSKISISSRVLILASALVLTAASGMLSSSAFAENAKPEKFSKNVRIAYVSHSAFMVDNGVVSGPLSRLMECATSYFSNIEFVEMSSYDRMLMSLETNVVDIGLNMVKSKARDVIANYAMDLYSSRILMVSREENISEDGFKVGILGTRMGSDINSLLAINGYTVAAQAYSIDRLLEMFLSKRIDSFAESEMSIYTQLKQFDEDGVNYDYKVVAEQFGGAYITQQFTKAYPKEIAQWEEVAKGCAYLAPKIES